MLLQSSNNVVTLNVFQAPTVVIYCTVLYPIIEYNISAVCHGFICTMKVFYFTI